MELDTIAVDELEVVVVIAVEELDEVIMAVDEEDEVVMAIEELEDEVAIAVAVDFIEELLEELDEEVVSWPLFTTVVEVAKYKVSQWSDTDV